MPEDVDIYIGIKVNTEELEKANQKLKELLDNFTKAKEIGLILPTQTATQGIENLGRAIDKAKGGVIDLSASSGRLGEVLSGLSGTEVFNQLSQQATKIISIDLGIPGDRFKQLWDIVSKAPTSSFEEFTRTVLMEGKKLGLAGEDLKAFQDQALALRGIQAVSFDLKIKAPSLKDISDFFGIAQDKIDLLAKAFAKLGEVKAPVIRFKEEGIQTIYEDMERLGTVYEKTSLLEEAARSAHLLQGPALDQLSTALRMNKEDLVKYGQEMEKHTKDFQSYRVYMIGMRGAIGPLGYAYRDVTMQLYWASLGFLFLTMTMTRHERTVLAAKQRAFDLAQAYYNLSELQRQVTETSIEYGAGSEEARRASVQLLQAQQRLTLQEEALLVATKADVLQGWQMQISIIPMSINAVMAAITAYGALNGILFANRTAQMQAAIGNATLASTQATATGTTISFTTATGETVGVQIAASTSTGILSGALTFLTGVLGGSAAAAAIFLGIITLGGAILLGVAASTILMNIATAQAEEQTRKLIEKAKEEASVWENVGEVILDVEKIFRRYRVTIEPIEEGLENVSRGMKSIEEEATGKSLDRSLLEILDIFGNLRTASRFLEDLNISYKITGQLSQPMSNLTQLVDLKYNTRELVLPRDLLDIKAVAPDIIKKGDLTLNISFPNLIIREEADINKIASKIDKIAQDNYYSCGGTRNI